MPHIKKDYEYHHKFWYHNVRSRMNLSCGVKHRKKIFFRKKVTITCHSPCVVIFLLGCPVQNSMESSLISYCSLYLFGGLGKKGIKLFLFPF